MKRLKFHRAIVAIAMMLIGWLPSLAQDFEVDGIYYNFTGHMKVEVTYKGRYFDSYNDEYNGDVVIPSSVYYNGTYSVTSIGREAFRNCSNLTSIEIPNSVTSIGNSAFEGCKSLTSIEIPNSVTSIGDYAFSSCSGLTGIEIPNSVTSIGYSAFSSCSGLTSVVIGNSVTSIGYSAFEGCKSLTSIVIPDSVTSIGGGAFEGCSSLKSVKIGNSVTTIGYYTFSYCTSLTSVHIGNSVTSIDDLAFFGCESLTSIVWNAIKCSDLSSNYRPFRFYSNITSFTFGDEVEHIPAYLCYNMSNLTSIEIPNSVTSIGDNAFSGCESLTSIVWNAIKCSDLSSDCHPFEYCSNITSFTFGDEVEHIPAYLCYNMSNLTSIEIPNSVTTIGDSAFSYCTRLTRIEIPNSVTSIDDLAFRDCISLTKITCHATTPPRIRSSTFPFYIANLYVPIGCKAAYEVANYWKNFNIIEITLDKPITLNDNDVIVATIGDNIVVKNATAGSVVRVYTADGALIASEVTTDGDVIIEAPAKGIYIVKVGKQTVKVII